MAAPVSKIRQGGCEAISNSPTGTDRPRTQIRKPHSELIAQLHPQMELVISRCAGGVAGERRPLERGQWQGGPGLQWSLKEASRSGASEDQATATAQGLEE